MYEILAKKKQTFYTLLGGDKSMEGLVPPPPTSVSIFAWPHHDRTKTRALVHRWQAWRGTMLHVQHTIYYYYYYYCS